MAGQFNKKELELLMGEITRSEPNITPDQYRELKGMEEMKPGSYPFRFMKEAPSENEFMKLLEAGVNDTKKEGIMTAQQYKLGGDLNYIIEMMKNETDPDKLEELKMQIREMLGTTPYMSIRQDPVRKAADGGFMETLKDKFSEFVDKLKSDEPRFFAGQPLNEAAENDPRYQANLAKKVYRDLGYSDEEIDEIVKKKAGDFLELGKYLNQIESLNKAEGGIVSLKDGGDPDDVPLKKTIKTPSTYGKRVIEDFLFDAGFVKIDPDTGKPRGSKGEFNKFLLKKGIKPGSEAGTTELNKILKKLGKPMYISLEMAQGAQGLSLAEEATGTKKGTLGAAQRKDVFEGVDQIRKEANKMDFKNTDQKYNFIKKEIKKKFPAIGAATLANLAKGTALGMGLEMFMPQELQAATIYSPEDMDKMLGEMAIREKFK